MWTEFMEILGQPWVVTVTALLGAAFSVVFGFLHRRRLFRVMDKIARNTEPRERDDERPAKPPASARDPDNSPIVPAATGQSVSVAKEQPLKTPVSPAKFTQRGSNEKLQGTEPREYEGKRPAKPPASTASPNNRPGVSAATGRSASTPEEHPLNTPARPTRFTQRQFDEELRRMLREKKERGDGFAEIVSGKLHRRVIGGSAPNRMPMACNAMWKLWERQGRKEENIVYTTPSGRSSTIRIRYDFTEPE